MKLEKLTKAQAKRIPEFREKWLRLGLSTEPADRPKAEASVDEAYRAAGLTPPTLKLWLRSPPEGAIAAAMLANGKLKPLLAQVGAQVGAQIGAQVYAQVGAQVYAQVRAQVGAQVYAQVGAQVGAQIGRSAWGQHDAGWLSFYDFFCHATGLQCAERMGGLTGVAASSGWWWPFAGAVILTDRPQHLARDAEGRLHCETRAAIEYRDGWGVFAWHGVRVPAEWIRDPKSLDPKTALSWPNIEQRRAAAEIIGWEHVLSALSARVIDTDADPMIGQLLEADLPDAPGQKFLRVQCGTKRIFVLPVPPEMQTALQSNCWTFGLEKASDLEQFRSYEART